MKVSVVLTTYNGEKYLYGLLDSLRNQTHKPEEVLICDDGYIDIDDKNIPENAVVIVNRKIGDSVCNYIAPYDYENHWYSFSGAYGASSDNRYSELAGIYGALPIHDRKEW